MTVSRIPEPEDALVRSRLSRRSVAASCGITVSARSMRSSTSCASATSEKTPRTSRRLAGIARKRE